MDRDTLLLNILLFFFPHFCPNYFISWKLPLEKNKLEVFVVFALPGWCFHSPVSGVGAWGFSKCQEPARKFQKYGGKNAVVSRVAQLEISKMLQELLSALSCGRRNSHRKNSDFFIIMHPKHAARFFLFISKFYSWRKFHLRCCLESFSRGNVLGSRVKEVKELLLTAWV